MVGDEQVRARVMRMPQPRQSLELIPEECWALLRSVPIGRVVFTMNALPAIRPVNHITDGHLIIIRSHLSSAIAGHVGQDGAVVCYEADDLNPVRHTGWSVIATGLARLVREPAAVARYERMLEPWEDRPMNRVIAIKPEILTGIRLVG